jgi:hypothetical protein
MTARPPVIAQQYSSTVTVALGFHFRKKNLGARFRNVIISFFFSIFDIA